MTCGLVCVHVKFIVIKWRFVTTFGNGIGEGILSTDHVADLFSETNLLSEIPSPSNCHCLIAVVWE